MLQSPRPVIITGASSNHYKSMKQLVASVYSFYKPDEIELVAWDLGLNTSEHIVCDIQFQTVLRKFDYSAYPDFYNINVAAGEYAWKAAAIKETVAEFGPRLYLWMDAGNTITARIDDVFSHIQRDGIYSGTTGGTIRQWVHPKTFEALNKNPYMYRGLQMRNGAIIGFNYSKGYIQEWFKTWTSWCSQKHIIAPEGSDRSNHRQDQALLTLSYWDLHKKRRFNAVSEYYTIKCHQDIG